MAQQQPRRARQPHDGNPHRAQQPHDNWARYYDFVYQQTYGASYTIFNERTEDVCQRLINNCPAGKDRVCVLDIGAGTGRLAIPLLERGHHVTAVEPSEFMCDEIRRKLARLDKPLHNNLIIRQDPIQNVDLPSQCFDIALLLFTVIAYITNKKDLKKAFKSIAGSLKEGGFVLLDVPRIEHFLQPQVYNRRSMKRTVTITEEGGNLYLYRETCEGVMEGESFRYSDEFPLRQWSDEDIISLCDENGLIRNTSLDRMLENYFQWTGATYYLFEKKRKRNR